jgi:hypothetical protein
MAKCKTLDTNVVKNIDVTYEPNHIFIIIFIYIL